MIGFIGIFLFLLDLCNLIRPASQKYPILEVLDGLLLAIFAVLYYTLEICTYWLFAFKYYTASTLIDTSVYADEEEETDETIMT